MTRDDSRSPCHVAPTTWLDAARSSVVNGFPVMLRAQSAWTKATWSTPTSSARCTRAKHEESFGAPWCQGERSSCLGDIRAIGRASYADDVRAINLPTPAARDAYDWAFAEARGRDPWPRESSTKVAYQLLSRGALPDHPGGLLTRVNTGDSRALDAAIQWLRFDPFCLWSGYLKRDLMRSIAKQKLSTRQAAAIQEVLLEILPRGRREEFRDSCRLARAVNDQPFRDRLRAFTRVDDAETRQRATWMLTGCERATAQ